jgi:hypothetical protein
MKNLITIIAFVFGLLFANSIFAQNQKHSTVSKNQTQSVAQNQDKIVFSDGDITVYCSTTSGKANTYYALNKKGEHVAVNVDGSEVIPASTTTATAKKGSGGGTTTTPPTNPRPPIKLNCVCVKKSPIGLCQEYECTWGTTTAQ